MVSVLLLFAPRFWRLPKIPALPNAHYLQAHLFLAITVLLSLPTPLLRSTLSRLWFIVVHNFVLFWDRNPLLFYRWRSKTTGTPLHDRLRPLTPSPCLTVIQPPFPFQTLKSYHLTSWQASVVRISLRVEGEWMMRAKRREAPIP
jgi:hypothetical protein